MNVRGYVQIHERPRPLELPHLVVDVGIVMIHETEHVEGVELVSLTHRLRVSRIVDQLHIGPEMRGCVVFRIGGHYGHGGSGVHGVANAVEDDGVHISCPFVL